MLKLAAFFLLLVTPALAFDFRGQAQVVDGDTLRIDGIAVRLFGIDAPELDQECERDGKPWACGEEARYLLTAWTKGKEVHCLIRDHDRYGRIVATCSAGGSDLASRMVLTGRAIDYKEFSGGAYAVEEEQARRQGIGLWAGRFQRPAEWRAEHR